MCEAGHKKRFSLTLGALLGRPSSEKAGGSTKLASSRGSTKAPDSIREEEEGDHVGELQQADVEAEGGRAEKFERARTYTGML